ncbi:hypothetical protein GW17_00000594 [Ensete ventricosum]|nr:hypothetical protein GW17_00000594 [Ensete ventricosum]
MATHLRKVFLSEDGTALWSCRKDRDGVDARWSWCGSGGLLLLLEVLESLLVSPDFEGEVELGVEADTEEEHNGELRLHWRRLKAFDSSRCFVANALRAAVAVEVSADGGEEERFGSIAEGEASGATGAAQNAGPVLVKQAPKDEDQMEQLLHTCATSAGEEGVGRSMQRSVEGREITVKCVERVRWLSMVSVGEREREGRLPDG